jgi:uncharacterized protein involved in type VI secretion and phage assembly
VNQGFVDAPAVRPASDNHLAEVVSVKDVGTTGRIEVKLLGFDGVTGQNGRIAARLCVPFAGASRGAFLVPEVGDEVVVSFLDGDPRQAVVLGGVWNGRNQPRERLGGNGEQVDRWSLVGKQGTRIAIVEESQGAVIELSTETGGSPVASITIDRTGGGSIVLTVQGSTLRLDQQGLTVQTGKQIAMTASSCTVSAGTVDVSAGQATFSGAVVVGASVTTPAVVAGSYTVGAGNVL